MNGHSAGTVTGLPMRRAHDSVGVRKRSILVPGETTSEGMLYSLSRNHNTCRDPIGSCSNIDAEAVRMHRCVTSWLRTNIRRLAAPSISKSRIVAFGSPNLRFVHPEVVR